MSKLVLVVSSLFICLALLISGFACWQHFSRMWKKPELEWCIERLEGDNYILEERPLSEFQIDGVVELYWFSDFRGFARQENVSHVYIDRGKGDLYFLREIHEGGTEANVFYYGMKD